MAYGTVYKGIEAPPGPLKGGIKAEIMITITEEQKQQFKDEGYLILESVIPENHLELLRGECQMFIDKMDAQMDEQGTDVTRIEKKA
ncbi:MAG: hypothetical protein QGG64_17725 [Candidatus Latescibacteria bacterium]|nr:hypothetical protein [Candidatus Latescibacterota bacterium]